MGGLSQTLLGCYWHWRPAAGRCRAVNNCGTNRFSPGNPPGPIIFVKQVELIAFDLLPMQKHKRARTAPTHTPVHAHSVLISGRGRGGGGGSRGEW